MFKAIVLFGAAFVQTIASQCVGYTNRPANINYPTNGQPCGCQSYDYKPLTLSSLSSSPSSSFAVTSSSPIAPNSLTITSENTIEGPLSVYGQLPFLGGVAFEAMLPTSGYGSVAYNCGSGNVGITSENYGNGHSDYGKGFSGFDGNAGYTGLDKSGLSLNGRYPANYGFGNSFGRCGCQ